MHWKKALEKTLGDDLVHLRVSPTELLVYYRLGADRDRLKRDTLATVSAGVTCAFAELSLSEAIVLLTSAKRVDRAGVYYTAKDFDYANIQPIGEKCRELFRQYGVPIERLRIEGVPMNVTAFVQTPWHKDPSFCVGQDVCFIGDINEVVYTVEEVGSFRNVRLHGCDGWAPVENLVPAPVKLERCVYCKKKTPSRLLHLNLACCPECKAAGNSPIMRAVRDRTGRVIYVGNMVRGHDGDLYKVVDITETHVQVQYGRDTLLLIPIKDVEVI